MLVLDRSFRKFAQNDVVMKFMADVRTLKAQQSRPSRNSLWHAQIGALLDRALSVKNAETEIQAAALKDWIPVSAATSATRGQGHPVARWNRSNHKVLKRVSHEEDFLFYRSPLSGNFEIECDLIDMPQVMIAGSYVGARSDRKNLDLGTFRAVSTGQPIDPQFSPFGLSVRYRAVVRDGTRTISFNGRPAKTDQFVAKSDPWIAIRCAGRSHGGVQELRIMGHPQVLDVVPLSNSKELTGWISYHDEPLCHETLGWTHVDDPESSGWIVGHPNPSVSGMSIEGLLRYQRPLIEDGSIDYEFFYDPDRLETHPALDRLAYILQPSGIRQHWLGDGRYDRKDLNPHNLIDVEECRRGPAELPLLAGNWNQLRLLLRGATVSIELNGTLVYQRNLETTNQRTFGLFHFLGNTAVRVRNAVMRGDWPKMVPPIADQELADDTIDQLDAELAKLKSEFSHDFMKDGAPDQYFKMPGANITMKVVPGPQGVQASQRSAGPHTGFNIISRFTLGGDFDVEARFTGLRLEGTGDSGIMLNAMVDGELKCDFRAIRTKTTQGNQDLHSGVSMLRPDGGRTHIGDSRTFEAVRGRIRMARRGQRVFYLFADDNSDHFFQFGNEPVTDAETTVDGIFLHTYCNGVSISQVTWTNLTLRAERIKWYSPTLPPAQEYLSVMQSDGQGLRIVAMPKSVGLTSARSPDWCTDQRKIVLEMSNGSTASSRVFVARTDGSGLKDLGLGCMPGFSRDGANIVCSVPGTGIVMMKSDGTDRQTIATTGWGAQWSPDGNWIAFAEAGNITLLDVNSRKSSQLLKGDVATRYKSIFNLGWSHDSRRIAFKALRRDIIREEVSLAELNSGDGLKVLHPNAHLINPDICFSPDNQRVIVSIKGLTTPEVKLYALNCKQPGPATPVFAVPLANHKISGYAWSHDGKSLAITSHYSPQYVEWTRGPNTKKESR